MTGAASERWGEMLAGWAIPEELIAHPPASPYFDPQVFIIAADEAITRDFDTPSDAVARDELPAAGSVLDVGCGAGAASLRLDPAHATGVDPSWVLLDAFAERAARLGIDADTVEAAWPEAAPETPIADVVVCHHVVYNVANLSSFAKALTAVHPMKWMEPYWQAMHGIMQPDAPTANDAVAVLAEQGFNVHEERWHRGYQMIGETGDEALARIARRLCLPPSRHHELRQVLAATPPPDRREVVTLWWSA